MVPKKNIIIFGLVALIIVGAVSAVEFESKEQETIELNFSFDKPVIETKTISDQWYHTVIMENLPTAAMTGEPRLPVKVVHILLPPNSQIEEIKVTASEKISLGEGYNLEPQGASLPLSKHTPPGSLYQNPLIYNSSKPFPEDVYNEKSISYFRGYPILSLALYPLHYVPDKGELFYYEEMDVIVKTRRGETNELLRALPQDEVSVRKMVDNPSVAQSYTQSSSSIAPLGTNYSYVIITDETLENAFQPLVEHKSQFISARIVNLSYIQSSYSGADLPEKIRNFITYAYQNWNTEYVLLGGDDDVIPHRGFYGYVASDPPEEDYDIPADLYYAALDGTWNDDQDSRWGEPNEADWYAEVYVGRAPVSNSNEATTFVNKVIAFETTNKPNIVQLHQSRLEHDNIPDSRETPEACASWIPEFYTINKLYEENEVVTKTKWVNAFSDGCLIIQHLGHGTYFRYVLNYEKDGEITWHNSDASELSNDFYPLHIAPICFAGAFDYNDCLGENYLLNGGGGTSACILNSRYGWYSSSNAHKYSGEFVERQFYTLFSGGIENLGKMMQLAKEYFAFSATTDTTYRWCYYEINLLGDPETPVLSFRGHHEPVLSYSPSSHDFGDMFEGQTASTTFEIWNSGVGTLAYSLSESCNWVYVSPTGGSSSGEHDTITVDINTTGLSLGHHLCNVLITSDNGSEIFTIEVTIVPEPGVVWVDDGYNMFTPGWMYDHFDNIQDGIDTVSEDGLVYVYNGIYNENIVINKKINLIGEKKNKTVIAGSWGNEVVNLTADYVTISNITIGNGGNWPNAGIEIYHSSNSNVTNCIVSRNPYGISLYSSPHTTFRNVALENNTYSLGIYGQDITHFYQDIDTSNTINGKPIYYVVEQGGLTFDNTIDMSFLGLISCTDITIKNLTLAHNCQGLLLVNTSHSAVTNCTFYNNHVGIFLSHSPKNYVRYTNIYNNSGYGVYNDNSQSHYTTNAMYNYWGSSEGPYHIINLNGTGDNVSNNVEFIPWLAAHVKGGKNESITEGENIVNTAGETDVMLHINATNKTDVTIISYKETPFEEPHAVRSIGKYIDVFIENESLIIWPITILIYYTQEDLDNAGLIETQLLGIYFFNESSNEWELYTDTGVNTTNVVVNDKQYAGYAWANAMHLTKLTICGDISPPQTTYSLTPSSPNGENEWYVGNVTITLNAVDDTSGVNKTFYKIDNGNWAEYTNPFKADDDGVHIIKCYSTDTIGNEEQIKSFSVKVDKTNPETTHSLTPSDPNGKNGWYTTDVEVTLLPYDASSGLDITKYRIGDGNWQNYAGEFIVSTEGEHSIEYYSIDNAGNAESEKVLTIKIDKTNPETTYTLIPSTPNGENGWYTTDTTFMLSPTDTVSRVNTTYYRINEGEWETYTSPLIISREGETTINFYSIDRAGHTETPHTKIVKIDKTHPTLDIENPDKGYLYLFGRAIMPTLRNKTVILGGITVEVNATDEVSEIKNVEFYVDGNLSHNDSSPPYTWKWRTAIGRYELKAMALDTAGRTASEEMTITIFSVF